MSIAAIYTRVSSKAQIAKGDGLASQESHCRDHALYKGYTVEAVFAERGVSGGLVDRPEMKGLLTWLRKHRKDEPVVIIDDISRIARSVEAHIKLRAAIGAAGGRLESPSIEFGEDADQTTFELVAATFAQHHRLKNAEQVRHRMTARLNAGYFCFLAPKGYKYIRGDGPGKVLIRDEPVASVLQEALEGFANGRFQTQADVGRFLAPHSIFALDKDGAIHPQRIRNLLTNKIYAGYYAYKPWNVPLTRGRHDALVSWETFQRIQTRLEQKTSAPQKKATFDDFPLRGHIACGSCGHPMTGYWAKGRNKRYAYYECFQKSCPDRRKSIKRAEVEDSFERLLKSLVPPASLFPIAKAMIKDIWQSQIALTEGRRKAQKQALKRVQSSISKAADRLTETDSTAAIRALEAKLEKLEAEHAAIQEQLLKSKPKPRDFDATFRTALDFLASPWKY
jgi:DNA invertase Pin-like site-specific DNA recombinase